MTTQAADGDAISLPKSAVDKVHALLTPRNIVIVGATERPNNWAQRIHRNLLRYGFAGPLFPMNPKRDTIWNVPCYGSFDALPERPDHLLVLSPAESVPRTLEDGAAAGARSATIISAGFAELTDPASVALTARLAEVIRSTGLAVSGPNCVGNINAAHRLMTNIEDREARIEPGPVSLVSQSGGVGMLIKRQLEERCIDVGKMVTTGNEFGLSVGDYVEYLAQDPGTKVILCYVEGLRNAARFLESCRVASRAGKPVVVFKTGISQAGREAAVAHTGSLAGSIEAFDAATGRAGVIRARTLDEMVEIAEFFAHSKPLAGSRIGAMTTSGGKRGIIIDAADAFGLRFPPLAAGTVERLQAVLGVGSDIGNPLDAGFAATVSVETYMTCVNAVVDDPDVDLVVLEGELPRTPGSARREGYLRAVNDLAGRSHKPIVYLSVATYGLNDYARDLRRGLNNVPFLMGSDRAASAIAAAMRPKPAGGPTIRPSSSTRRADLLALLDSVGGRVLDEHTAKQALRFYGMPLPREGLARSASEAAALARSIGFPVVLKVVSADLPHKSDVGGVVLDLRSEQDVAAAFDAMMARISALPGAPVVTGVLVCQQISGGVEVVLGAHRDPEMGPMVLFGSGGVAVELFKDYALAACPVDESEADALIDHAKAGILIGPFRGRAALDRGSIARTLAALSAMMLDAGDRIDTIEINPFSVREASGVCLDALIVKALAPA